MSLDDHINVRTKTDTVERVEQLDDDFVLQKSEILRQCLRIGIATADERGVAKMAEVVGLETSGLDDDLSFRVPGELSDRVESLADELSVDLPDDYHPDIPTKSIVVRMCLQTGLTAVEDEGVEVLLEQRQPN